MVVKQKGFQNFCFLYDGRSNTGTRRPGSKVTKGLEWEPKSVHCDGNKQLAKMNMGRKIKIVCVKKIQSYRSPIC